MPVVILRRLFVILYVSYQVNSLPNGIKNLKYERKEYIEALKDVLIQTLIVTTDNLKTITRSEKGHNNDGLEKAQINIQETNKADADIKTINMLNMEEINKVKSIGTMNTGTYEYANEIIDNGKTYDKNELSNVQNDEYKMNDGKLKREVEKEVDRGIIDEIVSGGGSQIVVGTFQAVMKPVSVNVGGS